MKFELLFQSNGSATLKIVAENNGEQALLAGAVGADNRIDSKTSIQAEVTATLSDDRVPYRKVVSLEIAI